MDEVLRQAPIELSDDIIMEVFNRNNKDVKKTLMELWEVLMRNLKRKINGMK